ncbi:hypothetical protein Pst134EA_022536 [Puccinia striiformis f. sp. tritici]|uniref:hypothetical protein n=1 Tax=Puccinia striiformis f. sp. tritici TaxID=168172 RepID=UPI00200753C2|nr:hypothetical protein Pst134EA_022536 [Puccinia striiformis f. sp. tritici]KAH9455060.1 hypothetical protein Pst134EA_022536 [Puccinia striiformis f. sp. tritici]
MTNEQQQHHRHGSNGSDSTANSFQLNESFVDEPLSIDGNFSTTTTIDQQNQQPFRYDTLTWAKEHEPKDSLTEIDNHFQIPTISIPTSSNPTSPLLRLNMNHPDMPTGPSICLTSATPLTAKPTERIQNFFDPSNQNSQQFDQNTALFQSLIAQTNQQQQQQQNSFLTPRPVRGRQRSKSESMGNQQQYSNFDPPLSSSFFPSTTPPISEFFPTTSSTTTTTSEFWAQNTLSTPQEFIPNNSHRSSTSIDTHGAQNQIMQQLTDSSYLQGLLEEFNLKKPTNTNYLPNPTEYLPNSTSSSFIRPTTQLHHRRSHSVSNPTNHRRGRSDGLLLSSSSTRTPYDSFIPSHQSPSTRPYNNPSGLSPPPPLNGTQQQHALLLPSDSSILTPSHWSSSNQFPIDHSVYQPANQQPLGLGAGVNTPSNSSLSEEIITSPPFDNRPRSYSHSSYESEDTNGSVIHHHLPYNDGHNSNHFLLSHLDNNPPTTTATHHSEFKSKTTAATKAAAIRRRKVGVAARYICEMCGESFTRRYNLRGHQRAHKGEKPFACGYPGCNSRFARAHDQKRHYKLHLGVKDYSCPICCKTFIRLDALQRHHKSDAGQACFLELQQRSTTSSSNTIDQMVAGSESHGEGGSSTVGLDEEAGENSLVEDPAASFGFDLIHPHIPIDHLNLDHHSPRLNLNHSLQQQQQQGFINHYQFPIDHHSEPPIPRSPLAHQQQQHQIDHPSSTTTTSSTTVTNNSDFNFL